MSRQRTRDTEAELALRRELYRRGLRYRVHRRPLPGLRREADIVFLGLRIAVFVDGCFWHGCPEHGTQPKHNSDFWRMKIEKNRARDEDMVRRLTAEGWTAVRVWEHEDPVTAAAGIHSVVNTSREATAARPMGSVSPVD